MFGSTLLDVALGIVATFLLVSLISSAVTEAISSVLKLRHRTLRAGVQSLLNDPQFTDLALELYNHALISPLGHGMATTIGELQHPPAYIDPHQFATALLDVLEARAGNTVPPPASVIAAIRDPQLRETMLALDARATRLGTRLSDEVGGWFDDAMDRLGGWYKRRVQLISFIVALALAFILNADAIRVVSTLWDRPVVAQMAHVGISVKELIDQLQSDSLIGWGRAPAGSAGWGLAAIGWSITAFSTLFGAAFWFDVLQNVVQVRSTGATPDEKLDAAAARR